MTNRKIRGPAQPVWLIPDDAGGFSVAQTPGDYAARQGQSLCHWQNDIMPGVAQIVLTTALAPGLVYNIPSGKRVFISQYCYAVETLSDNCVFEFGYTTGADGSGTFYALGPQKHLYTGAAIAGLTDHEQQIIPAGPLAYSIGARCITFRVTANDALCDITVGWHGWWENE